MKKFNLNTTKQKILMLSFFALIILFVGLLFLVPSSNKISTEAGEDRLYVYIKSYWYNSSIPNAKIMLRDGQYYSAQDNNSTGSVGYIEIYSYYCSGSVNHQFNNGARSETTTTGKGEKAKGFVSAGFFQSNSFNYVFRCRVVPRDGFQCTGIIKHSEQNSDLQSTHSGNYYNCYQYGATTYEQITFSSKTPIMFFGYDLIKTYYAVFSPINYNIYYHANGGYFADGNYVKSTPTLFYEDYNIINEVPTRPGYTFTGWYDNSGNKVDSNTAFTSTNKTTLWAGWSANNYNIYFDQNGGVGGVGATVATFGSTCPKINTLPTRNGYKFLGYYDSNTGGNQYYNESGFGVVQYLNTYDIKLYARWAPKSYKVKIDLSGGEVKALNGWSYENGYLNKSVTFDSTYGSMPTLKREGFTFYGYCDYYRNYVTESTYVSKSQDHTLYAQWVEHKYNIIFNANGGKGNMNNHINVDYTNLFSLNKNQFVKVGFVFKGWALSSTGEVVYKDTQTISKLTSNDGENINLYAVWEETWASKAIRPYGEGTQNNPYLIESAENLAWMASLEQSLSGYFKQISHIDLEGFIWKPIGSISYPFYGNYDGNGFAITNLTTSKTKNGTDKYSQNNVGLFGKVHLGEIKNVTILTGDIFGYKFVGAIAGDVTETIINSCQVYANVYGQRSVGSIVGSARNGSKVTNCYSKANIYETSSAGGIAGAIGNSIVQSCGFEGTLEDINAKLIAATVNNGIIKDCFANVETKNEFAHSNAIISDSIYIAGTKKHYYSGNYENWVVSTTNMPLPKGLYWLGVAGGSETNVEKLEQLGYTLIV